MSSPAISSILSTVRTNYFAQTSRRIQLIDLLIATLALVALIQYCYVAVSRISFPFNSYLSGMFSAVGSLVLTVALRIQLTNKQIFSDIKPERAFADYLVAMAVLHIAVFNYLG